MKRKLCAGWMGLLLLTMAMARAQTNAPVAATGTNHAAFNGFELEEKLRAECIAGRRSVCGRIIKILPGGLVVESGYPTLQRLPLSRSWLVPGTVEAKRDATLVESKEPGTICVGTVYLTDFPKSKRLKPKLYDYVVIEAFPEGNYTYASVGVVHHTVRHYSATLEEAVKAEWEDAVKTKQ